jgi:hypothetical protein
VPYTALDAPVPFDSPGIPFDGRLGFRARQVALLGRADTALSLQGRDDTVLLLLGNLNKSITTDLACFQNEDLLVALALAPPASVLGMAFEFWVRAYPGGPLLVQVPGTITDSGHGVVQFRFSTSAVSSGVYQHEARRTTPGAHAVVADGQLEIKPS